MKFSLRTLLILCLAIGVGFGMWARRGSEQAKVVDWIESEGGYVHYECGVKYQKSNPWALDYRYDVTTVWLHTALDLDNIEPLRKLKRVRNLTLLATEVTDLTPIENYQYLEWIDLRRTKMTVEDLEPLLGLKNLRLISISNTPITDEQIKQLQQQLPKCRIR